MRIDFAQIIDWTSVKYTVGSLALAVITWNKVIAAMSFLALGSTIILNAIKVYKELKNKK